METCTQATPFSRVFSSHIMQRVAQQQLHRLLVLCQREWRRGRRRQGQYTDYILIHHASAAAVDHAHHSSATLSQTTHNKCNHESNRGHSVKYPTIIPQRNHTHIHRGTHTHTSQDFKPSRIWRSARVRSIAVPHGGTRLYLWTVLAAVLEPRPRRTTSKHTHTHTVRYARTKVMAAASKCERSERVLLAGSFVVVCVCVRQRHLANFTHTLFTGKIAATVVEVV